MFKDIFEDLWQTTYKSKFEGKGLCGGAGGLAAWIDAGTGTVSTTNAQESDRGGFGCGSFVPTMD